MSSWRLGRVLESEVAVSFLFRLFDPTGFPARWVCGPGWAESPWLGWQHILSDLGVWSAYLAIPLVLLYFLQRRRDLPFRKIFLLFGAFIFACVTTHLMEAIIFWWPVYRLSGLIKLLTAVISWGTVFALVRVVPNVLAMRSPEELQREISARERAEQALQASNADLERRVLERTAELTRTADALREERELLQTTLRSIGDGVIVTDPAGRVTFLNGVAEQLTGWTTEEAQNRELDQVFQILDERTQAPVENPALRALREGTIVGLANHTVLRSRHGEQRPIDDSAAPIRGNSEIVRGAVLVFRDITTRQRAEDAVRQSQQRERERAAELEAVLRATPTPIWIAHDPQCRQVTGNPASYRLLRMEEGTNVSAAAVGMWSRKYNTFHDGRPLDEENLPMRLAIREGREIEGVEMTVISEDGHARHLYGNASPIRDREGMVRGAVSAFVDITEIKKSQETLQEADRRKDEFLATLAHELRNPLAPLRNSLEIMKADSGDHDTSLQCRATMERQLGQMIRLVDDLIDVSRISRNQLTLKLETVELATIMQHALEACRPLAEAANHELIVSLPAEPVRFTADAARMAQVVSNLLTNACKYSDPGQSIRVTAQVSEGRLVIEVQDQGIGISPEQMDQIFEMFTQLDRTLERTQGGLGIGLSLVKRLVEMHHGRVTAYSAGLGTGCTFTVQIPIQLPAESSTPARPAGAAEIFRTRRKILVADDNRDSAKTLATLLKLYGHEVHTAHDGEEALSAAEALRPEVILLDIGMPKMNGYDVCRRIREFPWGQKIVMAALTGWGQDEDRRQSQSAGFNEHFVKPVDLMELQRLISEGQTA